VLILGSGVVGSNAALIAIGMGASVTVAGHNMDQLRHVSEVFGSRVRTVFSARSAVETLCRRADLVVGAVLVPGAAAPKLITAETVKAMKPGAVIVDVSIDQYARCGGPYLDLRAEQRDGAVRAGDCRQGLCPCADGRSVLVRWAQHS
jgi:alanine dehydrogenase